MGNDAPNNVFSSDEHCKIVNKMTNARWVEVDFPDPTAAQAQFSIGREIFFGDEIFFQYSILEVGSLEQKGDRWHMRIKINPLY